MRQVSLVAAASMAAISLSACGATPRQRLDAAAHSLAASPYMQATIALRLKGAKVPASVTSDLGSFTLRVEDSSTNGATLSKAGISATNSEVDLLYKGKVILAVRAIGGRTDYFKADLSSLTGVAGLSASASQSLSAAQALLGNRWFSVPASALASSPGSLNAAQQKKASAFVTTVIAAIGSSSHVTAGSSGDQVVASGSLPSLLAAVKGPFETFSGHSATLPNVSSGTWKVVIRAPAGKLSTAVLAAEEGGNSMSLRATVTHDKIQVKAPSTSTPYSSSIFGGAGLSGQSG